MNGWYSSCTSLKRSMFIMTKESYSIVKTLYSYLIPILFNLIIPFLKTKFVQTRIYNPKCEHDVNVNNIIILVLCIFPVTVSRYLENLSFRSFNTYTEMRVQRMKIVKLSEEFIQYIFCHISHALLEKLYIKNLMLN